ncbi:LHFPL tetraspan subfamily member 4 protein [Sarcoptes scabiei]|uniref:Tetraspan membrane protein of hair cell stereocilia n=1 Tax=Sarcoptes scabiei TaxID=52283 RepID=A0A834VDZ8_SARSC|nr:LHFPL tetraspan subfamily member 4 protein [Sarcoptes scabiei]
MSMLVGVLIFPIGWDTPIVREVCGNDSDSYALGQCGIRWAFILALIGVVDSIVLSILAFVLGTRYVKLLPDHYLPNGTKYKGEINSAFMHPEYLPNKKLINNLQQNPLSAPNGTAGIIGGMKPSGTGSISPPGYLNGFGIESINGHPLPGNNQNGGNHHHHPHHSNLNEMERFSEYSHRTNRSSYKSSLIMGNNSSNHINTNLNVNLNPMQQPKSTKQSSSSSSSTSSSSALSFAASNSNKLPPPPPPPKSIQYQQRGKSSSSATTTTTAATPLSSSSSSSSAATTSSGKLSTPSVSASIHASSSSTSSIHHTFDNF